MRALSYPLTSLNTRWQAFLAVALLLLVAGCGERPERHLDLGLWYFQKGLVDDAVLEFKEVIRLSPADPRSMSPRQLDMVTHAHYNLAVAYAKKQWFELALAEAGISFDLRPTTKNRDLRELIRKRKNLESLVPDLTPVPD